VWPKATAPDDAIPDIYSHHFISLFPRRIDIDHELTRRDNKAIAISFAAYMVSVSLILAAVIDNRNDDPVLAVLGGWTFMASRWNICVCLLVLIDCSFDCLLV
jgi:uncharacterized MAPEG superfamily protein